MAFFKFRSRGQKGEELPVGSAESVDDMRRRARHRLIGATVLVLVAVLGFPLLFDIQPRSVPVDIPVVIPDRNKTRPPGPAAGGRVGEPAAAASAAGGAAVSAAASLDPKEEVVANTPPAKAVPAHPAEPKVEGKPEPKASPAPPPVEAKAPARADDGAKARALLDGRNDGKADSVAPTEEGRFVVQVGAFADAEKAREARMRVERAGLKTYTQVVETKDGRRIRVRVGPYAQRTDADKAAGKIKSLDLPASVLAL